MSETEQRGKPVGQGCPTDGYDREEMDIRIRQRLRRMRHKIVVLSGKGGVGKSTVAVNFAVALAQRGLHVGLLDIDLHGPSVPKMLRMEDASMHALPDGSIVPVEYMKNLKVMSIGFFLQAEDEAVIWRGPRKHSMIKQLLADVQWADLDYLVVDAPPGTGDEPLAILELLGEIDGAIVVTTPQQLSITDVRKSIAFCRRLECDVLGLVENMASFTCPHCHERIEIFLPGGGQHLAREAGVPFLGSIPIDPTVAVSGDSGRPFVASQVDTPASKAFRDVLEPILSLEHGEPSQPDMERMLVEST